MPYTPSDAPQYVRDQLSGDKLRQWVAVWNSVYERCQASGGDDCEGAAFAQANSVAGVHRQSEKAMQRVTKFASEVSINEGIITAVLSSEREDRDGDVIRADGWELDDFLRAPRLMSCHVYDNLLKHIGRWDNVRVRSGKLIGNPTYFTDAGNPEADYGDYLARRGEATYSVGFEPVEYGDYRGSRGRGHEYTKQRLLETSHVPIPSNADALTLMAKAYALQDAQAAAVITRAIEPVAVKDGPSQCCVAGCDDMSSSHVGLCADHLRMVTTLPPNPVLGRSLQEILAESMDNVFGGARTLRRYAKAGRVVSGLNLDKLHHALGDLHSMHDPNCKDDSCPYSPDADGDYDGDTDGDESKGRKAMSEGDGPSGGVTVSDGGTHGAFDGSHSHHHVGPDGEQHTHPHDHSRDGDHGHSHSEGKAVDKAEQSTASQNDLPDSAFAAVLPGGHQEDGKTVPRSLRLLPHHHADGSIDLPHLRNALARVNQIDASAEVKAAAERHLEAHAKAEGVGEAAEGDSSKGFDLASAVENALAGLEL